MSGCQANSSTAVLQARSWGWGRRVNILERSKGVGRGLEEQNEELGSQVVEVASIFVLCCWSRGMQDGARLAATLSSTSVP